MNRSAYRTTGLALRALSGFLHPNINIHNNENIPDANPIIFAVNHFTRAETLLLPYFLDKLTHRPIWSLASHDLFKGGFGTFLEKLGALSTKAPDRDRLIVKSLLTNEACWVIFPEGRMVKNKKIFDVVNEKGQFMIASSAGKHPPHTGAATLALRTEFYRQRLQKMAEIYPDEAKRLLDLYQIESLENVKTESTCLVPVNITYYPIRAKENIVSHLARGMFDNLSARAIEELRAEGTMLLKGADIDIRFGEPIRIDQYLKPDVIQENINLKARIDFSDAISAKKMLRTTAVHVMERYMSAIYSMTTVNHDHIFASLLKQIPSHAISEDDFRCRAYLVATRFASIKIETPRHTSLTKDQTHLLTDDRHDQFKNFMTVAENTGVVKQENSTLVKHERIFEIPEMHNARVENPVAVIANEVEPLGDFQAVIREIAEQSPETVRDMVSSHLVMKADFDFERDYANFFVAGESKKKNVGRPFLMRGQSNRLGIVLIHGYMAAPLEIRNLARHLNKQGYTVYAPRLKGHGTAPEDLSTRTCDDWVKSVDEGYAIVRNRCDRVVAGGFSMGAGLTLELATRVNGLAGIFAIAPPLQLQEFASRFVPVVNMWNNAMQRFNAGKHQRPFVKSKPENPHINYLRNPIAGVHELERLMERTLSNLSKIQISTLIIQSHADPTVNPGGSRKIFEKIAAKDKEYLLLNYDRHGIINGEGSVRVYRAIDDFIRHLLAGKG
ncbi:MAG: alpha/beta fold hydrolase [Thermodesulfobacteriota bacterium]|nr:alpha/beta fold hydrolase [Thermodesulfobacteriota bacterium]